MLAVEDRRVKLHVFKVDQARTDAVSHGDAVPDSSRKIGAVLENLPKPASGQHRFLRHYCYRLGGAGRQNERTETGKRCITVCCVVGVVGKREQVNRNGAPELCDPRCLFHAPCHRGQDGVAGQVPGVNDASRAVAALACELQRAVLLTIKIHVKIIDQQIPNRGWTRRDQLLHGGRVGRAVAGFHDVLFQ